MKSAFIRGLINRSHFEASFQGGREGGGEGGNGKGGGGEGPVLLLVVVEQECVLIKMYLLQHYLIFDNKD